MTPYRDPSAIGIAYHIAEDCQSGESVYQWADWGPTEDCPHTIQYRCLLCGEAFDAFRDFGRGYRRLRRDLLIAAAQRGWFPSNPALGATERTCTGVPFNANVWHGLIGPPDSLLTDDEKRSFLVRLGVVHTGWFHRVRRALIRMVHGAAAA